MCGGFIDDPTPLLAAIDTSALRLALEWGPARFHAPPRIPTPCMLRGHVIDLTLKPGVSGALWDSGQWVLCLFLEGVTPAL